MELLRIVAMFLVLLVHTNFLPLGSIDSHSQIVGDPLNSIVRIEFESLALICVNLFVLISGYFGMRPKLKSVANLLFQIYFWRIALALYTVPSGTASLTTAIKSLIPGMFVGDWFIPCYLMLMIAAPALNAFIDNSSKKSIAQFLIIFYAVQTIFGWAVHIWPYNNGYSFVSFIGLYVLGRYLQLHLDAKIKNTITFTRGIAGYALSATIAAIGLTALLLIIKNQHLNDISTGSFMRYTSPFNVLGAALLIIAFSHLKITNRLINRLAQSAFAVYIVHMTPGIHEQYLAACRWIYANFSIAGYVIGAMIFAITVYLTVAIADSARIWLWNALSPHLPTKTPKP